MVYIIYLGKDMGTFPIYYTHSTDISHMGTLWYGHHINSYQFISISHAWLVNVDENSQGSCFDIHEATHWPTLHWVRNTAIWVSVQTLVHWKTALNPWIFILYSKIDKSCILTYSHTARIYSDCCSSFPHFKRPSLALMVCTSCVKDGNIWYRRLLVPPPVPTVWMLMGTNIPLGLLDGHLKINKSKKPPAKQMCLAFAISSFHG